MKRIAFLLFSLWTVPLLGQDITSKLDACNVMWDVPGPTSNQSMPIGNGDIGLNVWVEPTGDLAFYISKTDSWADGDTRGSRGLSKIGGIHISMTPSQLGAGVPFVQLLNLHNGEIDIKEGTDANAVSLRVWVDANNPVIRVEGKSSHQISYKVTLDDWRKQDVISHQPTQITWYYRNPNDGKVDPHVANITFGATVKGDGLASKDGSTLESAPTTSQLISIYPLTATTDKPDQWLALLSQQVSQIDALNLAQTYQAHLTWWDQFWHRSWIYTSGDKDAGEVTEGYVLQRFVTGCAGRGAYPIKFNGSIFVVDDPTRNDKGRSTPVDADYRDWGGQYWFQNTRAMYWPRLQAGDFDELMPLFKMYHAIMVANAVQVKAYYKHDGSYFAETAPFWGSLKYVGPEMPANWNDHYFTDILDLGMMMLDYAEYTGDKKFLKETAVPMITDGLTFFREHFKPGPDGKMLLDPDNAIEMYWKAHNPAPDIAGLRAVLPRMIALPDDAIDPANRQIWQNMLATIPELPTGFRNGKKHLLPYEGLQSMKSKNGENPELYAIYPFRLYGLERPDLNLAIQTFYGRKCKQKGCWVQDPIQAAMLGLTDTAEDYVHFNFVRTDPHLKFLAFWAHSNDYMPDEDNGGNGENGLQQMLLQAVGKKLLLFPAWPKNWDVDFKLCAPFQTTVEGKYQNGKLVELTVTPPERKEDVIDMSLLAPTPTPEPPPVVETGTINNILSPKDPIIAVKQTVKGGPNIIAVGDEPQDLPAAIDGNTGSKYLNRAQDEDGFDPHGDNTGLVVTPSQDGTVSAVQFATANDVPDRDPLAITIEGSNDPKACNAKGNGFVLLYEGRTGLDRDPGRNQWGPVIHFNNSNIYKSYRVLVTETRGDGADAVQFSEIRLGN